MSAGKDSVQPIIFTSNYARHGTDPNAVAISARPPEWYTGKQYLALAPSWDLLRQVKRGEITDEQYAQRYLELLEQRNLTPQQVLNDVGKGAILLCYEAPGDFCHRRVVAEWIQVHTNVEVPELSLYNKTLTDLFEF